jgi:F0F1-type ATP synthase epsilon subunit
MSAESTSAFFFVKGGTLEVVPSHRNVMATHAPLPATPSPVLSSPKERDKQAIIKTQPMDW